MNYPTDLSAEEEERAKARLADLAEQFAAKRILRTSVWREVFERTWRPAVARLTAAPVRGLAVLKRASREGPGGRIPRFRQP